MWKPPSWDRSTDAGVIWLGDNVGDVRSMPFIAGTNVLQSSSAIVLGLIRHCSKTCISSQDWSQYGYQLPVVYIMFPIQSASFVCGYKLTTIWLFPVHGGYPQSSSISRWDFPSQKPSSELGVPPWPWNPPYCAAWCQPFGSAVSRAPRVYDQLEDYDQSGVERSSLTKAVDLWSWQLKFSEGLGSTKNYDKCL